MILLLRLCLFWLQTISGNTFTLACVFGRYRKLGQKKLVFCVNCKIRLEGCKTILGFILPSNELHPRKIEERERNSKEIAPEAPVSSHPALARSHS